MLIRILPDGKPQIIKDQAFCELLNSKLPDKNYEITSLIKESDTAIKRVDSRVTGGLNNAHGDWYEWLLTIQAWNFCCSNHEANLLLILPNITQFDVSTLYVDRLHDLVIDLRQKVKAASNVQLITSNPDFVIIDRKVANSVIPNFIPFNIISPSLIQDLEDLYKLFIGKCDYDNIVGYASVKASLRPDRRLQIAHEGSLMKALYAHLQTREWIINPKGIKYYAISTKMTRADIQALKTVATHSLTTVFSDPQAAVDDLFKVNSLNQADAVFQQILL